MCVLVQTTGGYAKNREYVEQTTGGCSSANNWCKQFVPMQGVA